MSSSSVSSSSSMLTELTDAEATLSELLSSSELSVSSTSGKVLLGISAFPLVKTQTLSGVVATEITAAAIVSRTAGESQDGHWDANSPSILREISALPHFLR